MKGIYKKRGWYYYQPPMINGNRAKAVALQTKEKTEAVTRALDWARKNPEEHSATKPTRISSVARKYRKYCLDEGIHSDNGDDASKWAIHQLEKILGDVTVKSITSEKLREFKETLRTSPMRNQGKSEIVRYRSEHTIHSYMLRTQAFFNWMHKHGYIVHQPFNLRVTPPKRIRAKRAVSTQERDAIISKCKTKEHEWILMLGFHAGLRLSEMVEARPEWIEIHEDRAYIHIQETPTFKPKDREARTIPLKRCLIEFIEQEGLRSPFLIKPKNTHKAHSRYRYNPYKALKRHFTDCGCPWLNIHGLRHTCATVWANAEKPVPIKTIARWLGDDVNTTYRHYVGSSENEDKWVDSE